MNSFWKFLGFKNNSRKNNLGKEPTSRPLNNQGK